MSNSSRSSNNPPLCTPPSGLGTADECLTRSNPRYRRLIDLSREELEKELECRGVRALLRQFLTLKGRGKFVTSSGNGTRCIFRGKVTDTENHTTAQLGGANCTSPPEVGQVRSAFLSGIPKCWRDLESELALKSQCAGYVDSSSIASVGPAYLAA
ncbi:hypothetical protein AAG570_014145 [Ranatra chinensis]|uniref:Uncharacterized protein n=1 Tax=Ranatra chinensis TaxID=642074 RepID=A0ABD0XRT2_9HEMI